MRTIVFITVMFMSLCGISQNLYVQEQKGIDGMELKTSNAVMEAEDGSLFLSVSFEDDINRIFKLKDNGEVDETKFIEIAGGHHRGYYPFFRHPDKENTNVYVYIEHGVPTVYKAIIFDNNLNVLETVRKALPYSDYSDMEKGNGGVVYNMTESCILDSDNNIVIMKHLEESQNLMLVKMDLYGDVKAEKEIFVDIDYKDWDFSYHSLFVYNESPLQYAFTFINSEDIPVMCMVVLDSDFNIVETQENILNTNGYDVITSSGLSYEVTSYDDNFYLASSMHFSGAPFSNSVSLKKIDKNHKIECRYDNVELREDVHFTEPYLSYKSMAKTNDGNIYWFYTKTNEEDFLTEDLYVSLFDNELNLLWEQKVLSGISDIEIMSAIVRENGDLVISGYNYWKTLYTIVVGRDFTQPMAIDEDAVNSTNVTVYPNPASDFVKISSTTGQPSAVKVYNCLGMLVEEIEINSKEIEINVSDYNSGVYFVEVDGEIIKLIKN